MTETVFGFHTLSILLPEKLPVVQSIVILLKGYHIIQ